MAEPVRVMVVDDTAAIRLLLRMNLELDGHEVIEARDGEQALDLLRDPDVPLPDVVTLDLVMTPGDGWWALGEIRVDQDLRRLPVAVLTASVQTHQRGRAMALGADAFLAKPFEPSQVVDLVVALARSGRPPAAR